MNDRAARVRVVGPLARYADGFAAVLVQRGYAPRSVAGQLQLMAHLSRWLVQRGLAGSDVTASIVEQFLQARRAAGYGQWLSVRGMAPLLAYLRGVGFVPVPPPVQPRTPVERLLAEYRTFLVEERGLAASTAGSYLSVAQQFLSHLGASGHGDLSALSAV
jgi:integrase/recombinase XerD